MHISKPCSQALVRLRLEGRDRERLARSALLQEEEQRLAKIQAARAKETQRVRAELTTQIAMVFWI